ncbi:MAG: redoxin domain-containing protein [Mucilaginibacter sp.]|uniref:redoxin domain-containing protein n=1 Tax=Mucilaginibacter sp. TaxID=1882438 RepID=UPI0034E5F222
MKRIIVILVLISLFVLKLQAQNSSKFTLAQQTEMQKLRAKVEANPSNLEAHQAYVSFFYRNGSNKINNSTFEDQYETWVKQFPQNYVVPFAAGEAYMREKNPKSEPFLLRASILNPTKAETWYMLSKYAHYTNNTLAEQEYLKKAIRFDPSNAEYAFTYAFSFKNTDFNRYDSLSLQVARRFPNHEYGALSLLWLEENSTIKAQKLAYYRQLYNRKTNNLTYWYLANTAAYFDLLLNTDPDQAFELGLTMVLEDKLFQDAWNEKFKVATAFLQARKLITENQAGQALTLLNKVSLDNVMFNRHILAKETLALFKAEAADANKQTLIAYDSLSVFYTSKPSDRLHEALFKYGKKLGIDSNSVARNIRKFRDSSAKPATDFHLDGYLSPKKSSLSDYKGKVVLLTYWEPASFQSKEQFKHFENVIKKFDSTKVAYLALNLDPIQNDFVLPFLKAGGYSFTPLHDDISRNKGNLTADAVPTSYLIDQKGHIIFSNFKIDANNERTLELMIKEMLAVKD